MTSATMEEVFFKAAPGKKIPLSKRKRGSKSGKTQKGELFQLNFGGDLGGGRIPKGTYSEEKPLSPRAVAGRTFTIGGKSVKKASGRKKKIIR